jgi:DNA-binding IclR family transcriptional regulator
VKVELKFSAFYILEYLASLSADALRCMTVGEIMHATGLCRQTVHTQLKWLRFCALIEFESLSSRMYRIAVTEAGRAALKEHHEFAIS